MYSNFRKEYETFETMNTMVYMRQLNFESFINQINQLPNQGFDQGKIIFALFLV